MFEQILTGVIVGSIVSLIGTVVGYLVVKHRSMVKEKNALEKGLQALLRSQIIQTYILYSESGLIPLDVMASVEDMYEQYHALGGNGTVDEVMSKLRNCKYT